MRKSLLLLAGVGAAFLAGPVSAQVRPAPLNEVHESYNDCFAVVTPNGFVPNALEGRGWRRGRIESDGSAVDSSLAIYGHGSRRPIIMLSPEGLCIVTARLEDAGEFEEFKRAWGDQLPRPDAQGVILFSAEGRMVRLAPTGTPAAPGLSIAVMAPTEN